MAEDSDSRIYKVGVDFRASAPDDGSEVMELLNTLESSIMHCSELQDIFVERLDMVLQNGDSSDIEESEEPNLVATSPLSERLYTMIMKMNNINRRNIQTRSRLKI